MKISDIVPCVPSSNNPLIEETGKQMAYVIQRDTWLNSEPIMRCRTEAVPFYNKHLGFLKGKNLPITCGKCGIEVREDVYVSYSGFCPGCLYKVNVGNNS